MYYKIQGNLGLNKKTIAKQEEMKALGITEIKRTPGRPKGSLNKKTIAKQEEMKALGITKIKRTPGRPKGSLNKKTIAKLAAK